MKFTTWLEEKVMPKVAKFVAQKHVFAIRTGIIAALPLTMVGSLFLILFFLPIPGWSERIVGWFGSADIFLAPFSLTMGIMAVFITIAIAHQLAEQYEIDQTGAGNIALVVYLMTLLAPSIKAGTWDGKLVVGSMGATSIFGGMIAAIFSVEIFRICMQKNIRIKMPDSVPTSVSKSFNVIIPLLFAIVPAWLLIVTGFDIHSLIGKMLSPLKSFVVGSNYFGLMFVTLLISLLWGFGIHGASIVMNLLVDPFSLQAITENIAAVQKGAEIPHIVTSPFIGTYIQAGGSGATLGLLLAMFIFGVKSYQLQQIRKISVLPGIFQINEPIIFGFPIVMNPIMMIPFILAPMAAGSIAFFAAKFNLMTKAYINIPWTTPAPIAAFLTTNDWKAIIVSLVAIIATIAIYAPFLKVYDKMLVNQELANTKK